LTYSFFPRRRVFLRFSTLSVQVRLFEFTPLDSRFARRSHKFPHTPSFLIPLIPPFPLSCPSSSPSFHRTLVCPTDHRFLKPECGQFSPFFWPFFFKPGLFLIALTASWLRVKSPRFRPGRLFKTVSCPIHVTSIIDWAVPGTHAFKEWPVLLALSSSPPRSLVSESVRFCFSPLLPSSSRPIVTGYLSVPLPQELGLFKWPPIFLLLYVSRARASASLFRNSPFFRLTSDGVRAPCPISGCRGTPRPYSASDPL